MEATTEATIALLAKHNELEIIDTPLDIYLEIPQLAYIEAKRADGGKALLFTKPMRGEEACAMPVLMNVFGSFRRVELIATRTPEAIATRIKDLLNLAPPKGLKGLLAAFKRYSVLRFAIPKYVSKSSAQEVRYLGEEVDLFKLPILTTWEGDSAPFITMGQVYTQSLDGSKKNLGLYRLQVHSHNELGLHWQIHKDSTHFFHEYKKAGQKMPVTIALGGDPLYTWCAQAPLPHGVYELMLYGVIKDKRVEVVRCLTNPLSVPSSVDIIIEGFVDTSRLKDEGPFGDHTGFYTPIEPYPVLEITAITHRSSPIYPATIVGKPPLEDKYMGYLTERVFLPLLQTSAHGLLDYNMPENGVFHNLILAKLFPQYPGHARQLMHAFWGVGQMSFVKHAIFVGEDAPELGAYEKVLKYVLDRFSVKGIVLSEGVCDALDHASPQYAYGGKLGLDVAQAELVEGVKGVSDEELLGRLNLALLGGDSALGRHSADFGDLEATADHQSSSAPKSPKSYESPTATPRILEEESQVECETSCREQTALESTFEQSYTIPTATPRILEEEKGAGCEKSPPSSLRADLSAWQSTNSTNTLESTFDNPTTKTHKVDSSNDYSATAELMDSKETSANAERYPLFSKEATLCHAVQVPLAMTEKNAASENAVFRGDEIITLVRQYGVEARVPITIIALNSAELMDCHAVQAPLAMTGDISPAAQYDNVKKVDSRENDENVEKSQNKQAESVFDNHAASGRILELESTFENVSTLNEQAKDSRENAASEKTPQNARAESVFDNHAVGGRIFDEKVGLCSGEQGDKTWASIDAASHKLPAFSQKANAQNTKVDSNQANLTLQNFARACSGLSDVMRIAILVDAWKNDLDNPYMLVWRIVNNIDAKRDVLIQGEQVFIDARDKPESPTHPRAWPKETDCSRAVIEALRAKGFRIDDELLHRYHICGSPKTKDV